MSALADAAGKLAGSKPGDAPQLTLAVDGVRYKGWTKASIERSLDRFSHKFELDYTDRWIDNNEPWPIRPGSKCQLHYGQHLLLTGWVNVSSWSVDQDSWDLECSGRSLSGDLEDCSAIASEGFWKFTPPLTIVNQLIAPFGLKAISTVSQALAPMERFQLNEGETAHDAIDRLCTALALLPISRPDGNIELVRGAGTWQKSRSPQDLSANARNALPVRRGRNQLGAPTAAANISVGGGATIVVPVREAIQRRLDLNDQDRYSDYSAIGQSRGNRFRAGKIITRMKESVEDGDIKRHRPLIVIAKHSLSSVDNLKARATWERNIRAGRSMRYTLLMMGVNAPNKRPWEPGTYCLVSDPAFGVDETMILVTTNIRANAKSLVTELEFTLPEAYSTLAYPAKQLNKKGKAGDNRPAPADKACKVLDSQQEEILAAAGRPVR